MGYPSFSTIVNSFAFSLSDTQIRAYNKHKRCWERVHAPFVIMLFYVIVYKGYYCTHWRALRTHCNPRNTTKSTTRSLRVIPRFVLNRGSGLRFSASHTFHPPASAGTWCSPSHCARRDLLWPPLLPGFSSLVQIQLLSRVQHTLIVHKRGKAARSIDRGSFKKN